MVCLCKARHFRQPQWHQHGDQGPSALPSALLRALATSAEAAVRTSELHAGQADLTSCCMGTGSLVKPERLTGWPSQLRRMLGTQAAFLVSGLVHESFLWYAP